MKKWFLIFCIIQLIMISNFSQACEIYEDESDKQKDCYKSSQKDRNNSIDLEELGFIFVKLSTFYDKLVDRFPIIEKIMEKIFIWIYLQISNIEQY